MGATEELRREALHEYLIDRDIDYNFEEIDCDEEVERIEIDYQSALINCYSLFRMLKEYDDIVSRFYFRNDKFYIFLN